MLPLKIFSRFFLFVVISITFFRSLTPVLAAEVIDQSQTIGTIAEGFDNTNWASQTFTSGITGSLTKVTLSLLRSASTAGDVTLELRDTIAGSPGSTILASTSRLASDLTTSQANYDFSFSSPASVTSGTVYALVLYRSGLGTITADFTWFRDTATGNNNPYAAGSGYTSDDNGLNWVQRNSGNADQVFTTYVDAPIPTPTPTSTPTPSPTPSPTPTPEPTPTPTPEPTPTPAPESTPTPTPTSSPTPTPKPDHRDDRREDRRERKFFKEISNRIYHFCSRIGEAKDRFFRFRR